MLCVPFHARSARRIPRGKCEPTRKNKSPACYLAERPEREQPSRIDHDSSIQRSGTPTRATPGCWSPIFSARVSITTNTTTSRPN
ncbi:hypothetical protein DEF28_26790, partial [Marinitenerispora sediminis]